MFSLPFSNLKIFWLEAERKRAFRAKREYFLHAQIVSIRKKLLFKRSLTTYLQPMSKQPT